MLACGSCLLQRNAFTTFCPSFADIDCGIPPNLSNARMEYSDTLYNSTVTYSCDTGYHVTGVSVFGDEFNFTQFEALCTDDSQWNISHPEGCQSKDTVFRHFVRACNPSAFWKNLSSSVTDHSFVGIDFLSVPMFKTQTIEIPSHDSRIFMFPVFFIFQSWSVLL